MSNPLNITTAAFGGLREVTTAPLWQWDYGQILEITGLDLPQAFEVHFSNSRKSGETVTQIGTDNQVTIPDMYLTSGADIYAFIFLHDGLTDGETEYVIKIPVRERPEPSDIEPTPEQQDVITQTIAALNNAVAQCEAYVEHYPTVIDGEWYVWDEAYEQFVSTGVPATGNGIASARLNSDYTLTLVFTDGSSFTTPISIRGEKGDPGEPGAKGDPGAKGEPGATGNGIASIAKTGTVGLVDTYTITFTDGTTTTFDVTNGAEAIDATLSIAGRAADAKATGDAVDDLKSNISETDSVLTLDDQVAIPFSKENDGYYIRFSTGVLTASSPYCTTNYIDVTMYKSLLYKRICLKVASTTIGMSFYDANKAYVSGERALYNQSVAGYQYSQISIPENAVYARFSINKNTETYGDFEVKGTSKLFDKISDIDDRVITNEDILSFVDNIPIDYDITETGRYIKYSDGSSAGSTPYNCTGYINISQYAILTYQRIRLTGSGTTGMAFYDASKRYISGVVGLTNATERGYRKDAVVVPSNAVYARFSTLVDTTLYGDFSLSGKSKLFNGIYPYKSPYQKDVIFGNYSSDWYEGQGDSYSGFTINTLYSEMITAWDALVANSKGYVTKDEIGTASDNQTMYCYKLIPSRYRNNTGTSVTNNPPTFLIIPSIHGYEKSAAFGTYYFARDLVYNFNKNPVLNSLRTKCAIYIVPVGNPYGFDNKKRKNANGVDLNRNWGVDPSGETDPSSPYYPGAEPFDQPETQAIKGLIDSNTNIFYVVDYHTNGQYKAASWADVNWMTYAYETVYNDVYSRLAYVAGQFQIAEISENLQIEYSLDTNGASIGSITIGAENAPRPTITYYTRNELNILGATFEGNNGLPSEEGSYSATEQKINSELIGNWIKNLLLVFKDASLK